MPLLVLRGGGLEGVAEGTMEAAPMYREETVAGALGMMLPGTAAIPAPYRDRQEISYRTGLRIVDMVREDLKPSDILTKEAFHNAIVVNSAIGGSTNAPIHLQAIARHLGVETSWADWQEHGHHVPLLVNLQPAGEYLGEDYYHAGGVPAVAYERMQPWFAAITLSLMPVQRSGYDVRHGPEVVLSTAAREAKKPIRGLETFEGQLGKWSRMDAEIIAEHAKGIIATTGCPSGEVQTRLRLGHYDEAVAAAAKWREIFGPDARVLVRGAGAVAEHQAGQAAPVGQPAVLKSEAVVMQAGHLAAGAHVAGIGVHDPGDHLQGRGLARPIRPDDRHPLARRDVEVDPIERHRLDAVGAVQPRHVPHAKHQLSFPWVRSSASLSANPV